MACSIELGHASTVARSATPACRCSDLCSTLSGVGQNLHAFREQNFRSTCSGILCLHHSMGDRPHGSQPFSRSHTCCMTKCICVNDDRATNRFPWGLLRLNFGEHDTKSADRRGVFSWCPVSLPARPRARAYTG